MTTKGTDNRFRSLTVVGESGTPATPASGDFKLYVADDGTFFLMDDTGATVDLTSAAVTDATISTSDITTNNASTSKHGWLKKLDNNAAHFLDGTGAWSTPSGSGGVASDTIWDAAGDLVQGTGSDTAAKLSAGTVKQALRSAGAAAANTWAFPPGHEYDYVQITSNVSVTATSEATANTIVTANAVSYDGSTDVLLEFFFDAVGAGSGNTIQFALYDGSSSIGRIGVISGSAVAITLVGKRRLTPSNASHTYSIRGWVASGTGTVFAGAGGSGNQNMSYIRQTKAAW